MEEFWDWTTRDSVSFYTFILAIFTGLLAAVSIVQGYFLYRTDSLGRESLTTVQRAFVFMRNFETSIVNNNFIIFTVWENSGTTPAQDRITWANWRHFETDPTPDFYLSDWVVDRWSIAGSGEADRGFIGPHALQYGEPLTIPTAFLERSALRQVRIFVWGWIEYRDVFSKGRIHRTEFCNELLVTNVGTDPEGKITIHTRFAVYGPYNTAN